MTLTLHHEFTFLPDGRGRVALRWTGPGGDGAPATDDFVRNELERARGVDAWADIHCERDDQHLTFVATAWFADASQLRFHCQGFHVSLLDFTVEVGPTGGLVIKTATEPSLQRANPLAADAPPADVSAALASEREQLAMARDFMAGMFGGLRCTVVVHAPGRLLGPVPGTQLDHSTVRVDYSGDDLLAVLDRLLTDDEAMLRLLRGGNVGPTAALELFGNQGPIELRTSPELHAAFDYDAEVAMARDALAPFLASLRVAMPEAGPAEPLARLRVLGARVVHEADQDADLCPFGESRRGVTLTVAGELPVTALELDQASLETAIDADGNDLTPADEWDRRVHFPKLTKDGRTAYLDIHLAPPPGVRGLQLLQGRLRCLHSCGSETVDLGFDRLGPEATGTVHGARILRLEHDDGGQAVLEVQLQVARGRVLGAVLRLPDGELPLTPAGYSSCNDECSLTYHIDGEVPPDARLEFSFATELTYSDFAFRLEQIDWLGQPL